MTNDIIVGLDIGTTKIACFVGQKQENGKVKILGHGKTESRGVVSGAVLNISDTTEDIKKAVGQASSMAELDIRDVYVGVAGQHIKSYSSKGTMMISPDQPYITEEDVKALTEQQYGISLLPGEEIIHLFPQTYFVDEQELTNTMPRGVCGNKLDCIFHVVTGNTNSLRNIKNAVEEAGLRVKGLVLEPVASSMAVLDATALEAGVALVDIGGGTTDIAIFKDGIIRHTAVLPAAGNFITSCVKEGCNVMKSQAEGLKTRFGSCLPSQVSEDDYVSIPVYRGTPNKEISLRFLAEIIKVPTEKILEEVKYEIEKSGFAKSLIAGIILTGGGAQLKHIKDYASFLMAEHVQLGLPNEHLDISTKEELIHPMYATAIGLLLYGIEQSEKKGSEPEDKTACIADLPEPPEMEEEPAIPTTPEEPEPKKKRNPLNRAMDRFLAKFCSDDD